ncbi:hypothetical protein D0469_03850 [Peribacillus saganii]|uniref:YkyB-like protein n=1 Tax=Peribacillus saganii TaxID=2303992 RepID=A0A372LSA2_9BACI|nr:YkyB family protein [Peribacillus saganii]RFU71081.1 hypothetical protein D0469_03850 [Peribacillus saganii]
MDQTNKITNPQQETAGLLEQAIFVVNKHAKTAPSPKSLYELKRLSLQKLVKEGKASKVGLHFSDNPRLACQQSDVIIKCGDYIFHLPPSKEDLKTLPHLGNRAVSLRNPKASLSLSKAKQILEAYIGKMPDRAPKSPKSQNQSRPNKKSIDKFHNPFPSTFLGKGYKY